ncbi:MAG: HDOD domain-containing protein [Syntrophorhabdaceae bacterium]|nr:HDOD domain-containing protein [Syntrophorhabdaceae bacterium]
MGGDVILERLKSGYLLPTLSPITIRLLELASDDSSSIEKLTDLIEKDPSLTTRVLRLANSPFYRPSFPVSTLRQAIMRIGFHQLRILALSLSLKETFPMGRVGNMDYERFWNVSLYRGITGRAIAKITNISDPDEAFITGLILEIGLLIFYDIFLKGKDEEIRIGDVPFEALLPYEREKYGINHRDVGEYALRYWKFPEAIVASQRYKEHLEGQPYSGLMRVLYMAERLSSLICYQKSNLDSVFSSLVDTFGIKAETLNEVIITALNEVDDVSKALHIKVEQDTDIIGLLEKANRALLRISQEISGYTSSCSNGELPSFAALTKLKSDSDDVSFTLQALAHEIRNPLTVVGGFVKRLKKTMDPSSNGWKYMEAIIKETERLENILKEATEGLKKSS